MLVTTDGGIVENNTALVGILDPGGYFTLDSVLIPDQEGPLELTVRINYTDDFNQPREIEQKLVGGGDAMPWRCPSWNPAHCPPMRSFAEPETFFQKVLRFFRGLFGLDSAAPQPEITSGVTPDETKPIYGPGLAARAVRDFILETHEVL